MMHMHTAASMTSFSFDFDLADDLDETFNAVLASSDVTSSEVAGAPPALEPYTEVALDDLVSSRLASACTPRS